LFVPQRELEITPKPIPDKVEGVTWTVTVTVTNNSEHADEETTIHYESLSDNIQVVGDKNSGPFTLAAKSSKTFTAKFKCTDDGLGQFQVRLVDDDGAGNREDARTNSMWTILKESGEVECLPPITDTGGDIGPDPEEDPDGPYTVTETLLSLDMNPRTTEAYKGETWTVTFSATNQVSASDYTLFYFADNYDVVYPITLDPETISFLSNEKKELPVVFECVGEGTTQYGLSVEKDAKEIEYISETITCKPAEKSGLGMSDGSGMTAGQDPESGTDDDYTGDAIDPSWDFSYDTYFQITWADPDTCEYDQDTDIQYCSDGSITIFATSTTTWPSGLRYTWLGFTACEPSSIIRHPDGIVAIMYAGDYAMCGDDYHAGDVVFPDGTKIGLAMWDLRMYYDPEHP